MNKSKIPSYIGLLAGLVAVIWAIVLLCSGGTASSVSLPTDTGTYTMYEYYGGDAYTGMQQASADTARNVKAQSDILRAGFRSLPQLIPNSTPALGAILLCMGLGMIAHFLHQLKADQERMAFESRLLSALEDKKAEEAQPVYEAAPVQETVVEEVVEEAAEEEPVQAEETI